MNKVLVVDVEKCTGCKICVVACSSAKERVFDPIKARIRIVKEESSGLSVPLLCEQCERPPCQASCPVGAITKDTGTGIVKIDPDKCTGCGCCKQVCPFGSETIKIRQNIAIKCDLCDSKPECVKVCLSGALQYLPADPFNVKKKRDCAEKRTLTLKHLATMKGA